MNQLIKCLQLYNSMGFPLFPCYSKAKAKAPITTHGFKDASIDWQQIEQWHEQNPDCAWAIATSAERGVIDIDPRHAGHITLANLIAQHGPLPLTPKARTGGDGFHHWFQFPKGTTCRDRKST